MALRWQSGETEHRARGRGGHTYVVIPSGYTKFLVRQTDPSGRTVRRQLIPRDPRTPGQAIKDREVGKSLAQQWEDERMKDPVREAKKAIKQAEREVCPECGGSKDIGCICPHGAKAGEPSARDNVYDEITRGHQQRLRDDQAWKDHLL